MQEPELEQIIVHKLQLPERIMDTAKRVFDNDEHDETLRLIIPEYAQILSQQPEQIDSHSKGIKKLIIVLDNIRTGGMQRSQTTIKSEQEESIDDEMDDISFTKLWISEGDMLMNSFFSWHFIHHL